MTRLTPPKSPVVSKKKQSSCMWGLYSLFAFRQGRSDKKLLSNRKGLKKHVVGQRNLNKQDLLAKLEGKCQGNDDINENLVDPDIRNEKKIQREEMSTVHQMNLTDPDMQSTSKLTGQLPKNHGNARRKCQRPSLHSQVEEARHKQTSYPNSVDKSLNKINLAASTQTSCKQLHPKKRRGFGCKGIDFVNNDQIHLQLVQMKDAAEAIVNQKFIEGKHLSSNGANQQPKQLLDALEILNKNRELFTKLLQDPNSLLVKHIQNLRDSQTTKNQIKSSSEAKTSEYGIDYARKCQEPVCTQKLKSLDNFMSKGRSDPQFLERIIVLKPDSTTMRNSADQINHCSSVQSCNSLGENAQGVRSSDFSFGRVTRKLRNAVGVSKKDQHSMSLNIMKHTSSYDCHGFEGCDKGKAMEITRINSPSIIRVDKDEMEKYSPDIRKMNKVDRLKDSKSSIRHETVSTSESNLRSSNSLVFGHSQISESRMSVETQRHLSEMLKTKNVNYNFSQCQAPQTWQRSIDFLPIRSPVRDREHCSFTAEMRFFPYSNCHVVYENNWRLQRQKKDSCSSSLKQNTEAPSDNKKPNDLQFFDTKRSISENLCSPSKVLEVDSSFTGCAKILEVTNTLCPEEKNPMEMPSEPDGTDKTLTMNVRETNFLEVLSISDGTDAICASETNDIIQQEAPNLLDLPSEPCINDDSITSQRIDITNTNEEDECFKCSRQDSPFDDQPSTSSNIDVSPSTPSSIQRVEDPDGIKDGQEQSSPVSVLEPFFTDVTGPESAISEYHNCATLCKSPLNPEINRITSLDYQTLSEFIREVLQASGINWDELLKKCHASEQVLLELDPSVLDSVKLQANQCWGDCRLINDCIKDVLLEVYHSHFRCSPWVSLMKLSFRKLPVEKSVIHEVKKCIDWHLVPETSLEQIIVKDLARSGTWLDIWNDVEDMVVETVESKMQASFVTLSGRNLKDMMIVVLLAIFAAILGADAVQGWGRLSKEEDLEMDRQLKLINKPAIKSFQTEYGDNIDCVDIYKQYAFDHPMLKNHTIQMKPTSSPKEMKNEARTTTQYVLSDIHCPQGSVPIRRSTKEDLILAKHIKSLGLNYPTNTHENISGIDLGGHHVTDQFSIASMWLSNGPRERINSIQAGWGVNQYLYPNGSGLYAFWTTLQADGYQKTGCFNTLCPGFVQASSEIHLGVAIEPCSTYNGRQFDIPLSLHQDIATGSWWLMFGDKYVGYWPKSIFTSLAQGASEISWGGEVYSPINELSPAMGSGHFPEEGFGKAAFVNQIKVLNDHTLTYEDPSKYALKMKVELFGQIENDGHQGVSSITIIILSTQER
ncbi:hypothetical protein FNV43_RR09288 [Rhamnella rubrinervis]|uniref:Neprosin PEP catalytic domain-containing protein n=1 Tax=Rhamnella rubrinervis TaxID=2594499 RepID=A0A8K0HAX9_9ROSA|nr:hypothetical protein FNV43_RR09288 [Rhamnella rubrinervis]